MFSYSEINPKTPATSPPQKTQSQNFRENFLNDFNNFRLSTACDADDHQLHWN
ncbi:hypothetical protein SBA4_2430002 [Candidatus Sulfopaludibacter sp. SbA4]|nr:hypothetical protein SBA4_2430002 [Candidatus Sulfopaludibacter sp. SbA4]